MTTITHLRRPVEMPSDLPRPLAYRYELPKPTEGPALIGWIVEQQLSDAYDAGCPIATFGALAKVPAEDIEELLDLADQVHDDTVNLSRQVHHSIDAYADQLAVVVRAVSS